MADFIVMPKLGFDMREGEFVGWNKAIGEVVNKGDVVAEIESDKATLELEAQVSGVLLATLVEAGDIVAVGANVAIVGEEGEDVSGLVPDAAPAEKAAPQEAAAAAPAPAAAAARTNGTTAGTADQEYPAGVKATPVARRMASEKGVDLLSVPFAGERIRKADVEAFLAAGGDDGQPAAAPALAPVAPQAIPAAAGPEDTMIPATKLRQAIARRMTESKTTVPHFQVTMEIDMGAALALRQQLNDMLADEGVKISINDILVKAAGLTLREFPMINGSFAGKEILLHNRINVGSAVATDKGLLTVVQKDTDKTTLGEIARQNKAMIERAREGKNLPDDFTNSTFTISNLGVYGVAEFIAIINPPEAAIMAVGGIHEKPVFKNGELTAARLMKVTVSADHRVTDGAEVARFLVKFKELLENPMKLLV